MPHKPPPQTVSFPSGSTVTFAGVSYGKVATPPTGFWKRRLAFLPDSLLRRLKIYPGPVLAMQSNHIIIWLFVTPPGSSDLFNPSANPLSLVDENGVESYAPNFMPYYFSSSTGPNDPASQGLGLAAFPRRAKKFRLRIYSKDPQDKLTLRGEMTIPNPAFHDYPTWQPALLPATQTNGGVTITLTRLETGVRQFSSEPADTNEETWGNAYFTLKQAGKPCRDWTVDNIEFSDASGNGLVSAACTYDNVKPGQGVFRFRTPLWPAESAWKLKVILRRKPGAKFAPGELWSITNLSLPALNSTNSLNLKTNLAGLGFGLASLVDESGMLPPETRSNYYRVRLIFQVPTLPPDVRFDVLSVTGRDALTNAHSRGLPGALGGTMGTTEFIYMLPALAKTLDVKVGAYHQLTAEFTVKPTVLSRKNSISPGAK
ncbi:MAG TPA: hypothetical protein VK731_12060 [Candidatus Cybelea sp.]|nr:hypothetical protein [Candidatus Cybelea sp.]